MSNLAPTALPWQGLAFFPALLAFIAVMLFSTATLAFYLKQRLSFARMRAVFAAHAGVSGNVGAALLGAATPFCTCTALPLFLGMLEVEVPFGPAVSFLLASPTINLGAVILLLVVFGWRVALFYLAVCLTSAVLVGWLLGRVPQRQALRDYLWIEEDEPARTSTGVALKRAASLGGQITRRFLPWLALATAAGLLIDWLIPTTAVVRLGTVAVVLAIPLAAALGGVIYADILLLIPLGYALIQHGAPAPVVLTFMIAASGLSLPELAVLTRVLRPRMVLAFAGAALLGYAALGYGFLLL
ncbi:MAG TPA: permease [Ktedonobacterales bacterium]|nr:permease [Ktedonobacterales bacterium]